MEVLGAIGKFHLADHVDSCFSKFTLNFLRGAGHIDGEIMETLWSGMNKVSVTARSMGNSHRQETLDDYMRDSNWKKMVRIGKSFIDQKVISFWFSKFSISVSTLITKLKRSQIGLVSTKPAFEQLTESCLQRNLPVEEWTLAADEAMEERGEKLSYFDLNHEKAPTLTQITLQLTNSQEGFKDMGNAVGWISDGIKAQDDQLVIIFLALNFTLLTIPPRSRLRFEISKLPQKPTVKQQLNISRLRARLAKRVKDFLQLSVAFLPDLEDENLESAEEEDSIDTPGDEYVEPEDPVEEDLDEDFVQEDEDVEGHSVLPETVVLPLPSNIISAKESKCLHFLMAIERELRKGQANDALEGIRMGLANKSLLLLTEVNQSKTTKQNTRAWSSVRNTQSQILIQARCYQRAWQAIKSVGTPEDLDIYKKLEPKDLVTVKDITSAKRFGQGSDRLAWFWRIGPSEDALTGEWMEECK
jgi:Kyakuja-Dileera-Zisupton transposase